MKKCLISALILLILVSLAPLMPETALAAPGDFLLQWGAIHQFNSPHGVAVDSSGNLYVTDFHNLQVFDRTGKFLRSWGSYGSGQGQFNSPYDVAVAGNRVYVLDSGNNRVQVFTTGGTFVKTWGAYGSGNGQLNFPEGIGLGSGGNVYVADTGNNRIQVFDSNGAFLKAFGGGTGAPLTPGDVAVDAAGNIYAADATSVRVFDSAGTQIRAWQPHGSVGFPHQIALDSAGNVYITELAAGDFGPQKVQVYSNGGSFLREWGNFGFATGEFFGFGGLTVDSGGKLYVGDNGNQRVQIFDNNGGFLQSVGGVNADGQFWNPQGVATDSAGRVYVADSSNSRIQVFDSGGSFLRKLGSLGSGSGQFASPYAVTVDSIGNLFVGDNGSELGHGETRIQMFDATGNFVRSWGLPGAADRIAGMGVDSAGYLYVSDRDTQSILVYSQFGNLVRSWGSFGSGNGQFNSNAGVAVDGGGNVYVADSGNHRIQVFSGTGNFIRAWGSAGGGDGQFYYPAWVAVDGSGNVYVTDYDSARGNSRIQAFDSTGKFRGKWGSYGSGDGQFLTPAGIAADFAGGKVYVVDTGGNRVEAFQGFGEALSGGWAGRDIGSVGIAGKSSSANGTFTLQGSGDNIWGTADAFRYKPLMGDGEIVARVTSVQNTNGYAKGGVMIRASLAPNAVHAMVDLTPGYGAEFSRRLATGGSTSVGATAGISAPYWVKLVRQQDTLSGFISKDRSNWTSVGSATIAMPYTVYAGLIANSHNNAALCTAVMDGVSLAGRSNTPSIVLSSNGTSFNAPATIQLAANATPSVGATVQRVDYYSGTTLIGSTTGSQSGTSWSNVPQGSYTQTAKVTDSLGATATSNPVVVTVTGTALPNPWLTQDIGSVGVAGSASYQNGSFTLKGSGSDIWGSSDSFRFVYKVMNGDGQIIARVASLQNTSSYAKVVS